MSLEIERKFLVVGPYKAQATSHTHIVQGYLSREQGRTVRVRLRDERGYLTIKGPSSASGMARYEFEKEITAAEARALLGLCLPGVIDKTRWLVPCAGHTVEVDEFHGENNGLVVAEIELGSEDEAFERPAFLGREVTGDRRYYNSQLGVRPYASWRPDEKGPNPITPIEKDV